MNTIGKILVILNFLFAVTVVALLVLDVSVRTPWKQAYEDLKREAGVLKDGRDVQAMATGNITGDYQRLVIDLDAEKKKVSDAAVMAKAQKDLDDLRVNELIAQLAAANTTTDQVQGALKRQVFENDELKKTIKERQELIVKLETDNRVIRLKAGDFERKFLTADRRNADLLDQLSAMTKARALETAGINPDKAVIKNPTDANPPAVLVNGKVEQVDGADMVISVGTDHGVNKNHTLDIYRLQPEPKYLGMVRIINANTHKSVARLIPSGNPAFRPALRVGDLVSSKVTKSD